jgi:hypothetical protein
MLAVEIKPRLQILDSSAYAPRLLAELSSGILSEDSVFFVQSWMRNLDPQKSDAWDLLLLSALLKFPSFFQNDKSKLKTIFQELWKNLMEESPPQGPQRFKKSFLKKQGRRFCALHAALFLEDQTGRRYKLTEFRQDLKLHALDMVFLLGALVLALSPWGRELLLGFAVGLFLLASFTEALTHRQVGHTGRKMGRFFKRLGKRGEALEEISLAHKLHHIKVAQEFNVSFQDETYHHQFDRLARNFFLRLTEERARSVESKEVERLFTNYQNSGYGVDATLKGSIRMILAAMPFYLLLLGVGISFQVPVFLASSLFFGTFFILQSVYSHRYLHMNKQEMHSGLHETTGFMRWFMSTRMAQFQQRLHFVHHQYHLLEEYNDVIMVGSGADWLQGKIKAPNCQDLYKMDQQNFLDY